MCFNKEKHSFYRLNNKLPVFMIEKRRLPLIICYQTNVFSSLDYFFFFRINLVIFFTELGRNEDYLWKHSMQ